MLCVYCHIHALCMIVGLVTRTLPPSEIVCVMCSVYCHIHALCMIVGLVTRTLPPLEIVCVMCVLSYSVDDCRTSYYL